MVYRRLKKLKIANGLSESENRMTDNAIARERKKTKSDLQNTTQKTKIEQDEPY